MQLSRGIRCSPSRMNHPAERHQPSASADLSRESRPGTSEESGTGRSLIRGRRARPRLWLVFASAIVASIFLHEIGHCVVAWILGYPAVPTPAKEYVLRPLSDAAQNRVALGGMIGTVAVLVGVFLWMARHPTPTRSALLAGAMTLPGFYCLRFFLTGRGHDATEFQEAQAAMGFSYSGHALDWVFLGLFAGAAALWFWQVRPSLTWRLARRLIAGAVAALVVLIVLQSVNNAVFDPLFERERGAPPDPASEREATAPAAEPSVESPRSPAPGA